MWGSRVGLHLLARWGLDRCFFFFEVISCRGVLASQLVARFLYFYCGTVVYGSLQGMLLGLE